MRHIGTYTVAEFEYNTLYEAERHSELMKVKGYYEVQARNIVKLQHKGKIVKAYKRRKINGIYY